MVSATPNRYNRGKNPRYPLYRGLDRSQCRSGWVWGRENVLRPPVFEPRTLQPVASRSRLRCCGPIYLYNNYSNFRLKRFKKIISRFVQISGYGVDKFSSCSLFSLLAMSWPSYSTVPWVEASWNVMAHAQKPDFVFRRNGRVHLNRRGRQFNRLLAAQVCASAVVMAVMLDTPCSEVVWGALAAHSIRQFPLHFPSRASPCAYTFQLESTNRNV